MGTIVVESGMKVPFLINGVLHASAKMVIQFGHKGYSGGSTATLRFLIENYNNAFVAG